MPEYIERKPRYIDIKKFTIPRGFFNQDLNVPKIFDLLYSQPTADVVEVVRCKDCKFYETLYCAMDDIYSLSDNDFCSYGIKKEGAEK
jgi:hypothetical protein